MQSATVDLSILYLSFYYILPVIPRDSDQSSPTMSDSKEKRGEAEICANDCCWFLAQLWSGVSLKPNGYPSKAMMTMAVQTNMDDEAWTHCSEFDQFVQNRA